MIYTCIKYPLPGLVYILIVFVCNDSHVSLNLLTVEVTHNNWWMFTTFMLSLDSSFFFKTQQIQISQLPTWSGPTQFSSLLVNTCTLTTNKILGEIWYIRLFRQVFPKICIKHLCMHAPQPIIYSYGQNAPFVFFFVAEMSGSKHPRPKCPTFGLGVTANKNNIISIYTDYYRF